MEMAQQRRYAPTWAGPALVALIVLGWLFAVCSGCDAINKADLTTLVDAGVKAGAQIDLHGELGPAYFGPTFKADLGARVDFHAYADPGAVTARDLLSLANRQQDTIDKLALTLAAHRIRADPDPEE